MILNTICNTEDAIQNPKVNNKVINKTKVDERRLYFYPVHQTVDWRMSTQNIVNQSRNNQCSWRRNWKQQPTQFLSKGCGQVCWKEWWLKARIKKLHMANCIWSENSTCVGFTYTNIFLIIHFNTYSVGYLFILLLILLWIPFFLIQKVYRENPLFILVNFNHPNKFIYPLTL